MWLGRLQYVVNRLYYIQALVAYAALIKREMADEEDQSTSKTSFLGAYIPAIRDFFGLSENTKQTSSPKSNSVSLNPEVNQSAVLTYREYQDQKKEIQSLALANCADLEADLLDCFNNGSWWNRVTLCETQRKKFWDCVKLQKDTLKEMNYKSPLNTPEQEFKIRQHAELVADQFKKELEQKEQTKK